MKHRLAAGLALVCVASLAGCGAGVESRQAEGDQSTDQPTVCDFGSPTILVDGSYLVVVEDQDLNPSREYVVRVEMAGTSRAVVGEVPEQATMVLDVEPWRAGEGRIEVYHTESTAGAAERTLAADCSFQVNGSVRASTGNGLGGGQAESWGEEATESP